MNDQTPSAPAFTIARHPSADIHPDARLHETVRVAPFAVVGPNVTVGAGTRIGKGVLLDGWTTVGEDNELYPGAIIGTEPQDFRYKGEESWVIVGDRNIIREFVTINRAHNFQGRTVVGNENLLMACTHVAHNCVLGNGIIMTNYSGLAGHVEVEDFVVLGGYAGVHQFVRIGTMAMVGGHAKVIKDIPPYAIVDGQPARIYDINRFGLRKRGVKAPVRASLRAAFRLLTRSALNLSDALQAIQDSIPPSPEVDHLIRFMGTKSKMGVLIRFAEKGNGRVLRGDIEGGFVED